MSKHNRDGFVAFVEREASSGAITDDQLETIRQIGPQKYKLIPGIIDKVLKDEGFIADDDVNYFEELGFTEEPGFTIETFENQSEATIKQSVTKAHTPLYTKALLLHTAAGVKKRELLNRAKNILIDPKKRERHIRWLNRDIIYRFPNGDVATSPLELATLMQKHIKDATDALYQNDIAENLDRVGENHFATAARIVVRQFRKDRNIGFRAMVAILLGKVRMKNGSQASTPQQLARLIDQNWSQAKSLLYNDFFALWLEHTNRTQLASTAKTITDNNPSRKDIGLEAFVQKLDPGIGHPELFVQKLDPGIGHPELEVSQPKIDFGRVDTKSQKTIDLEITKRGRGFLHGDVQIESALPWLQISATQIQGEGVISVGLDTSRLTPNQMYQTALIFNTKGRTLKIPISCYVSYPVQQSVQDVAISGFSVGAIALIARLIIQQFGSSGWLGTHLTAVGFTDWTKHWQWVKWFEWPGFEWKVYTLSAPWSNLEFVIAFASLSIGIFAYWYFLFKKKRSNP